MPPTGPPVRREGEGAVAPRQCGRCRLFFDGDPTLHQSALPAWWLCGPCRTSLLGDRAEPTPR